MKAPQGSARDSSRVCLRVPTSLSTTVPPAPSPPLANPIAYAVHRTRHIRGSLSLPTPQRATGCISRTFSCPLRPLSCPPPRTRTQDAAAPSTSLLECVPTTVPVHAGAPPAVLGLVVAPHSHYLETCRRPRRPRRPSGINRSRRERCGRRPPPMQIEAPPTTVPHVLVTTFGAVASLPRNAPPTPTVPAVLKKAKHGDVSARANSCAGQTRPRDHKPSAHGLPCSPVRQG